MANTSLVRSKRIPNRWWLIWMVLKMMFKKDQNLMKEMKVQVFKMIPDRYKPIYRAST